MSGNPPDRCRVDVADANRATDRSRWTEPLAA
jgi:hypothetical protein